ncbi:hypothetical protein [Pararhodobacter zhoushanensis]|jgi:hypothetical protein|uniref:Uncharacterized protein n=1 Tax=Pararhodobacter zhoushanensis TaxID=2479545 RepID=A0ABT3GXS6_9RHOB|nr:hypothetical protein [Pararhodobacter zhoushanensis]MCW1932344.1 hypothetical protein [Pararhodobacter zhoushanensis]
MNAEPNTMMTETADVVPAAHWAPPAAPLDMPRQRLEAPVARLSLVRLIAQLLPRQRV